MSVFYKLTRNGLPTFAVSFKNTCPHVVLSNLHPFEPPATLRPLLSQIGHYTIMRKQTFFLSSAFPFFGCNGTPLRPQNVETSEQKQELLSS